MPTQSHDDAAVIQGAFGLFAMVHTMTYEGPHGAEDTRPWDGSPQPGGPYTYASLPCNAEAPVNNVSSDLPALGGAVAGARAPASTRNHPLRFDVLHDDGALTLQGSIALTVCQRGPGSTAVADAVPDVDKDRIDLAWTARVITRSDELISWRGRVELVGGTGVYQQLRGAGDIAGYFFCFAAEGCAELGVFRDAQYAIVGDYCIPAAAMREVPAL